MNKTIFAILSIVEVLLFYGIPQLMAENQTYKLLRTDSINNYYLFFANKNDSVYEIVAEKKLAPSKMMIGAFYSMDIYPQYGYDKKYRPLNYLDVRCASYKDNTEICFKDGCIPELYNLRSIPVEVQKEFNNITENASYIDWEDSDKQCENSIFDTIVDSLNLKEIVKWQNDFFQTKYNYHFKFSKQSSQSINFQVKGNDYYLTVNLENKKSWSSMSMSIFQTLCRRRLKGEFLISENFYPTFYYLLMAISLKFSEGYIPEEFVSLRQPPKEDYIYIGGGVFNSHKFHRFYDSFDSFFKNQKLSVAGLKEFLAKYVADENPRIFAMVDYDGSILQKDSIRIDIVTESTGILYSYKGDKCFAQPFEYSSKTDKNGQNIRHCKIKKVMAQSSDFLTFKVSDEFTITNDSELNFRFRRGGKKGSYQLNLKVLTEEEMRMEM